jgi:hypothetical protein
VGWSRADHALISLGQLHWSAAKYALLQVSGAAIAFSAALDVGGQCAALHQNILGTAACWIIGFVVLFCFNLVQDITASLAWVGGFEADLQ